jgi:SurA N-terminal domain
MAVKMWEKQFRDVSPGMRRAAVVAAVFLVGVVAIGIVALVRSRGSDNKTIQTVAGEKIKQHDLELTVEHFHEDADREGKPFPAKGTDGYKRVETISLGLLIDQAAIRAGAAKLGVLVSEAQVDASVGAPSGESEEGGDIRIEAEAAFARATARTQLIIEGVSRKLTAGLNVPAGDVRAYYLDHRPLYGSRPYARVAPAIRSQLLSARKNAVLTRWLAKVRAGEPRPKLD